MELTTVVDDLCSRALVRDRITVYNCVSLHFNCRLQDVCVITMCTKPRYCTFIMFALQHHLLELVFPMWRNYDLDF